MCIKNCFANFIACEKRGIENIGAFFRTEHTPLENGLLCATALLGGIVLGYTCCPGRIVSFGSGNGSCNGCGTITRKTSDSCKKSK